MLDIITVALREDGCFSCLLWDGRPFAVSVERTFEDLRTVVGNGNYVCTRDYYDKGGYATWQIPVAGHTDVLFHKGNLEINSIACVCIAESFGMLNGVTAVLNSKGGFEEFMQLTADLEAFNCRVTGRLS